MLKTQDNPEKSGMVARYATSLRQYMLTIVSSLINDHLSVVCRQVALHPSQTKLNIHGVIYSFMIIAVFQSQTSNSYHNMKSCYPKYMYSNYPLHC